MFCLCSGLKLSGQYCDQPQGYISIYYAHTTGKGSGVGIEAGVAKEDFPVSTFMGVSYIFSKALQNHPDSVLNNNSYSNFYLKLAYRIFKMENRMSSHIVISSQLNLLYEFNFGAGIKLFAPVSERVALEIEPFYFPKQKYYQFNFHLAFAL
jgi:hypothetical protein